MKSCKCYKSIDIITFYNFFNFSLLNILMKEYISIEECINFCDILGYETSQSSIRRMIVKEEIRTKKENKKIIINRLDFVNYILQKNEEKNQPKKKRKKISKIEMDEEEKTGLFSCLFFYIFCFL